MSKFLQACRLLFILFTLSVFLPAEAQDTTDCEDGFRLFNHELLATDPVCIPDSPQRIVIGDFAAFDVMYTFDIPAVGYSQSMIFDWYENMVPELMPSITEYLGDAVDVGSFPVNFEAILEADPDLILLTGLLSRSDAIYEQFSAIAPTVVKTETNMGDWREAMRFYGEALNIAEDVDGLLADYETRLETLRTDSNGLFEGKTVSLVQINDPETILLMFPSYRGWLPLQDVGFIAPEAQVELMDADNDDHLPLIQLSNELVGLLDTDYIVLMNAAFDPENSAVNQELFASYETDPLWSMLPAVQAGHLVGVDMAWQANGLISAQAVIDDMYRLFLRSEPTTPNPYADRMADDIETEPTPELTGEA